MSNICYVKTPTFVINANGRLSESLRPDSAKGLVGMSVEKRNFDSLKEAISWINKESQKKSSILYLYEIRPSVHGAYNVRYATYTPKKTNAKTTKTNPANANRSNANANRTNANANANANRSNNTANKTNANANRPSAKANANRSNANQNTPTANTINAMPNANAKRTVKATATRRPSKTNKAKA